MELTEIEAGYDMVDSHQDDRGGMCEWLKQAVLKTAVPERVPGVRIPLPPPYSLNCRETRLHCPETNWESR